MSDPSEPTRTLTLTGPELLRATRTVLADQNPDPDQHTVTPWFGAHAALKALPNDTKPEVMLAAQAIAIHYAERESVRRAGVEGLPELVALALRRQAKRMQRALATTLRALEHRCGAAPGANQPGVENLSGATQ